MTHRFALVTSIGVWVLLFAVPARADIVVFSNFDSSFSYNTGGGNFIGNGLDGTGSNYAQGAAFTPTTSADFSSLDIALSNFFGTNTDTLTVSLDANSSGAPGAALESFTVSPGVLGTFGNNNAPLALNSVLDPLLTAGTQYWVTVSDAAGIDSNVWNWNDTGDTSSEAISTDGGTTWFSPSGLTPGAYQVNGTPMQTVPAPSIGVGFPAFLAVVGFLFGARLLQRRRVKTAGGPDPRSTFFNPCSKASGRLMPATLLLITCDNLKNSGLIRRALRASSARRAPHPAPYPPTSPTIAMVARRFSALLAPLP
jgi:hypothetical protein